MFKGTLWGQPQEDTRNDPYSPGSASFIVALEV